MSFQCTTYRMGCHDSQACMHNNTLLFNLRIIMHGNEVVIQVNPSLCSVRYSALHQPYHHAARSICASAMDHDIVCLDTGASSLEELHTKDRRGKNDGCFSLCMDHQLLIEHSLSLWPVCPYLILASRSSLCLPFFCISCGWFFHST